MMDMQPNSAAPQAHREPEAAAGGGNGQHLSRRTMLAAMGAAGAAWGLQHWLAPLNAEAHASPPGVTGAVYGNNPKACCEQVQEQVQELLQRFEHFCHLHVKEYGAQGDGVADDTAAIQAAIDAADAQGGGIVCITAGIYMLSAPLAMRSRVILQGEGDVSVLKAFADSGWGNTHLYHGMIDLVGVQYSGIRSLCLHQNSSARTPAYRISYSILANDASDCLLDDVTLLDPGLNDEYGQPSGPLLAMIAKDEEKPGWGGGLGGCYRFTVRKCRFIQSGTATVDFAVRVLSNWENLIPTDSFTYYNEGHTFIDCVFRGEYAWNTLEFAGGATRYNKVLHCLFDGQTLTHIDFDKGTNHNVAAFNTIQSGGKADRYISDVNKRMHAIDDHGTAAGYLNYGNTIAYNSILHLNNDLAVDNNESAISVSYSRQSLIVGNTISGVNGQRVGGGIFISKNVDGVTIENNRIRNVRKGIFTDANSLDTNGVRIRHNVISALEQAIIIALKPGAGKRFQFIGNQLDTAAAHNCLHVAAGILESPVYAFNTSQGGVIGLVFAGQHAIAIGNVASDASQYSYQVREKMTLIGNVSLRPGIGDLTKLSATPVPALIGNTFTGAMAELAPAIGYSDSAPIDGTWKQGDLFYHTAPAPGGYLGWICTASGTPGIWKTFGAISV